MDVFALGVTIFVLYFNEYPFVDPEDEGLKYTEFVEDNPQYWVDFEAQIQGEDEDEHVFISEAFVDLINGMLRKNPEERLKIDQIQEHNWLKGPVATREEVVVELNKRHQKIR